MIITKTCLYKFDPLKPHLYIVKLGFPGVYIIFLISAKKNIDDCEQKYEKYQNFYLKNFSFLEVKFSTYLNRRVFVMVESWYLISMYFCQIPFLVMTALYDLDIPREK